MIITLTPNPAVDQTVFLGRLAAGGINRARGSCLDPAGKGINVSRIVRRLGWPTIAFGFLAGEVGSIARRALDREKVPHQFVEVPGQTRLNVTVVEEDGWRSTRISGPGPEVGEEPRAALADQVKVWLRPGAILVLAGRLPPGVPADFYAAYVRLARERGARAIVDADGEPLRLAIDERPAAVKPNLSEATALLGRPVGDEAAAVEAAREIAGRGVETAVVTLGSRGAVGVRAGRAWRAVPPPVERRSAVGSGDSFVAALAVSIERGRTIEETLRAATAAGAATAMAPGTAMGSREDAERLAPLVTVEPAIAAARPPGEDAADSSSGRSAVGSRSPWMGARSPGPMAGKEGPDP